MYRILIAEDEMIERMVLKKTLQKKFDGVCEVLEAENGKEALRLFRSVEINIVILDIEMPGMKGVDVAEIMRQEKNGFCIIFLTAYDRFEYARKAISVRAMEYLLKPYSEKEIIDVVEEAIRLSGEYERYAADKSLLTVREPYLLESLLEGRYEERVNDKPPEQEDDSNRNRLNVMVSMIEEYIRKNYMNMISMQDAAHAINYSEPYFCKMFKQQYGKNFTSYLTEYRVEEAKKLLMQPNVNVKEVGVRIGYPDSTYFARVFRRMTGESPSEYRNRFLKEL
ncbi:MAG: response regulator [bacterium]|nr:response regulator [bacterium]